MRILATDEEEAGAGWREGRRAGGRATGGSPCYLAGHAGWRESMPTIKGKFRRGFRPASSVVARSHGGTAAPPAIP